MTVVGAALGDASYSLYLSHPLAIRPLRDIWVRVVGAHLPVAAYLIVSCSFAMIVAVALHKGLERPALSFLQRKLRPTGLLSKGYGTLARQNP
jgi:peptidoglycan/LPS O-acetylase OafA/YrhL